MLKFPVEKFKTWKKQIRHLHQMELYDEIEMLREKKEK